MPDKSSSLSDQDKTNYAYHLAKKGEYQAALNLSQLTLQGAELKMVRMLRYETTSIAQIAWINADYGPMALCISPVDEKRAVSRQQEQRHSMTLAWWQEAGYQFVLIGRNPPSRLRGNAEQLQRVISG